MFKHEHHSRGYQSVMERPPPRPQTLQMFEWTDGSHRLGIQAITGVHAKQKLITFLSQHPHMQTIEHWTQTGPLAKLADGIYAL